MLLGYIIVYHTFPMNSALCRARAAWHPVSSVSSHPTVFDCRLVTGRWFVL